MSPRAVSVAVLSLSLLIVAACKSPSSPRPPQIPEQNSRVVYPPLPETTCKAAPKAPAVDDTDNSWAAYKKQRDDAGDDCRTKLQAVDGIRKKWPSGD